MGSASFSTGTLVSLNRYRQPDRSNERADQGKAWQGGKRVEFVLSCRFAFAPLRLGAPLRKKEEGGRRKEEEEEKKEKKENRERRYEGLTNKVAGPRGLFSFGGKEGEGLRRNV